MSINVSKRGQWRWERNVYESRGARTPRWEGVCRACTLRWRSRLYADRIFEIWNMIGYLTGKYEPACALANERSYHLALCTIFEQPLTTFPCLMILSRADKVAVLGVYLNVSIGASFTPHIKPAIFARR